MRSRYAVPNNPQYYRGGIINQAGIWYPIKEYIINYIIRGYKTEYPSRKSAYNNVKKMRLKTYIIERVEKENGKVVLRKIVQKKEEE